MVLIKTPFRGNMYTPKGTIKKKTEETKMTVKDYIKAFGEVRIIAIRTDWSNQLYYGHGYGVPKEYETATIKDLCGATPTNLFI